MMWFFLKSIFYTNFSFSFKYISYRLQNIFLLLIIKLIILNYRGYLTYRTKLFVVNIFYYSLCSLNVVLYIYIYNSIYITRARI